MRVSPYSVNGGGAVVTHIDITSRVLARRVAIQAKQEFEEALQLKSALLANMSHEIRTPLTSITGFAELLSEDVDGEAAVFAERILHSAQRLTQTLDSVLQFSRLDSGAFELQRSTVALTSLLEETVVLLRPLADKANVALAVSLPDAPVIGPADENAVHRVLTNLIENAIKFTEAGGRVEVAVRAEDDTAVFTVSDTGMGMSEAFRARAFEPFQQESTGLERTHEGTGLGLAIVKHLVDALGGCIEIESEKGAGTRCTVRLPL
jgi:signal transduction histidine kinase